MKKKRRLFEAVALFILTLWLFIWRRSYRDANRGNVAGHSEQRRFLVVPLWPLRSAVSDPPSATTGRWRTRPFEQVPLCKSFEHSFWSSITLIHTFLLVWHSFFIHSCFVFFLALFLDIFDISILTFDVYPVWSQKADLSSGCNASPVLSVSRIDGAQTTRR